MEATIGLGGHEGSCGRKMGTSIGECIEIAAIT